MKQLFLLLPLFLFAQNFDKAKMNTFFDAVETNNQGMGSVSIFKDGTEVYSRSIGFADVAAKQRANAQTKYRIGSITKTYVAVIILQLIEEGKLTLDTKLSKFFPKVENSDKITIEHMLRHRSGIFNIINASYVSWKTEKHTREALLNRIYEAGTVFEVDEKYAYSNSGFLLLTFIAEDIEKASIAEILNKRIVKPLGVNRTDMGGAIRAEKNEAHSYELASPWKHIEETEASILLGAGAMNATPHDVNVFFHALFNEKLLKEESLDNMTNLNEGAGLGIFRIPFYGIMGYGHTGGIDGYRSTAVHFPSQNVTVTYTANAVVMIPNDLLIGVLSIYFGQEYTIPLFAKEATVSMETLKKYVGNYVNATFPLDLNVFLQNGRLFGQATGQGAFPLTANSETEFEFKQANLSMVFDAANNAMSFTQGGRTFEFKKDK